MDKIIITLPFNSYDEYKEAQKEILKEIISELISEKLKLKHSDRWVSRIELAKSLNISLPTLSKLTKSNILTSHYLGGKVFYLWEEVEANMKKNKSSK